jgi:Right handed beta helix region
MTRTTIVLAAALALAVTLPAVSAQAQSPRTFVSAAGSDSNPCSFAAPCRHFQAAVSATSAEGEVDALDPAGYGPITITQAITIEGQGWSYIAPPAGGAGITINASSGNVVIRGVSLNGVGITGTTTGIQFNSGFSGINLTVTDCVIQNFTGYGLASFSPTSVLLVSNSHFANNATGIEVFGGAGVIDHVVTSSNTGDGLFFGSSSATVSFTVSDTVISNNKLNGVHVAAIGNFAVMLRNVVVSNNVQSGVFAEGAQTIIRVAKSTITGNATGFTTSQSGQIESYGDNNLNGNTTDGAPTSTIVLK